MEHISNSESQTKEIGLKIAKNLESGGVLYLIGDLGSGKTFLTKSIAEGLKIENFLIKSPTYNYIREYKLPNSNLYHIDLYRLEQIDELLLQEIIELTENPSNIIIIEWADKIPSEIDLNAQIVEFQYIDQNSRKIKLKT